MRVDVIIFSENGITKLVECKRCSQDQMYIYPDDLRTLANYYHRLIELGHNPQMILSLWFPKRRITREVILDPELVAKNVPLKFELKGTRLRRCAIVNSYKKKQ